MKILVLSQLEEFLNNSSCFCLRCFGHLPVRDPLETSVDEFILFKWSEDAVFGQSSDEVKGWPFLDEVDATWVRKVKVVGHCFGNASEELVECVIVEANFVEGDLGVGNQEVISRSVNDEVVEWGINVSSDIQVEFDGLLWGGCGRIRAEEANCNVKTVWWNVSDLNSIFSAEFDRFAFSLFKLELKLKFDISSIVCTDLVEDLEELVAECLIWLNLFVAVIKLE